MNNRLFYLLLILLTCSLFVSDQIVKTKILDHLTDMQSAIFIPLGPFVDIILVWNTGISFGLLSNSFINRFIPILTVFVLMCLFYFCINHAKKNNQRNIFLPFAFVFGGACGNMADRFYYGAVLDYIDFYYGKHHFPAFNLADIYIFVGAVIFFVITKQKNVSEKKTSLQDSNSAQNG